MPELIKARTTKRNTDEIILNISNGACFPFGFKHEEVAIRPDGLDAIMMGVAPGNDGEDVMWYEIVHPSTKGRVCYWGGERNLLKAGFKKKTA